MPALIWLLDGWGQGVLPFLAWRWRSRLSGGADGCVDRGADGGANRVAGKYYYIKVEKKQNKVQKHIDILHMLDYNLIMGSLRRPKSSF